MEQQFSTPPPIPSCPPPPIPPFPPPDFGTAPPIPVFYVPQQVVPIAQPSISHQSSAIPIVSPITIHPEAHTVTATNVRVETDLENVRHNVGLSTNSSDSENTSTTIASMDVTDLDFLLRLGYEESNVKKALTITSGDKMAALFVLSRSLAGLSGMELEKKEYSKWRKESDDDWISGVSKFGQPNIAINRAIQKSPIYIGVGSSYRKSQNDEVQYNVTVSLKDGRNWSLFKSHSEFTSLWSSLPIGTCVAFKNSFPILKTAFPVANAVRKMLSVDTSGSIERLRHSLSEWIRELVLNESCMSSQAVLNVLYRFVEVDSHGGPVGVASRVMQSQEKVDAAYSHCVKNSKTSGASPLFFDDADLCSKFASAPMLTERSSLFHSVPRLDLAGFPVTPSKLTRMLPFKVDAVALKARVSAIMPIQGNATAAISEADMKQLAKDMSRDRIVVQGIRILGSHSPVAYILDVCKKCILQTVLLSGQMPSSSSQANSHNSIDLTSLDSFCSRALLNISRTESAFLSHAGLHQILLDPNSSSGAFLVVPESTLADALLLRFSIKLRDPPPQSHNTTNSHHCPVKGTGMDWCVLCEGEASTVFRVLDAESMVPVTQVRVTFLSTLFAMPTIPSASSPPHQQVRFTAKEGRSYLIVSKETTSTERDWGKPGR